MEAGTIGQRISAYRRRRGLSQPQLAGLIGRPKSWLSQVERGVHGVDRLSVLLDLSRVLRVEVADLIGRPWQLAPNGPAVGEQLAEVRRVFTRYEHLLGDSAPSVLSLPQQRTAVEAAHRQYQGAHYGAVIAELPRLLVEAERLRADLAGTAQAREACEVYISSYVVAAKLVTKLGDADLAVLASDRAASEAHNAESQIATGLSMDQVACALLRADRLDEAERLVVRTAERLDPLTHPSHPQFPTLVSAAGAQWLLGAVHAARQTEREHAGERLGQAQRLADALGHDANYGWTAFGPTNVAIHRVSVAAELGDPGEALRLAEDVDPDRLAAGLASRRAQMHLDLAWAFAQRRDDAEATLNLLEAERRAPETIRYNVIAHEMVREMLARGSKSRTRVLADLATRAGLLN